MLQSLHFVASGWLGGGEAEPARRETVQGVVDEGGLSGSGHAGHAAHQADRKLHFETLQVVAAGTANAHHLLRITGNAKHGDFDAPRPAEELSGDRFGRRHDLPGSPLRHYPAAVQSGARPHVDHVVRASDRLFVVLDHDEGIADVAQVLQRIEQAAVVALVKTDGGLVQGRT